MWEPVAGAAGLGEERCLGALDVDLEEVDSDHAVLLHQLRYAVGGEGGGRQAGEDKCTALYVWLVHGNELLQAQHDMGNLALLFATR